MGYLKIPNLYSDQAILLFRECYALEKVHGTSAHVAFSLPDGVRYFAGGVSHEQFVGLFDGARLDATFREIGHKSIVVHGEAYGGSCQKMAKVYGPDLRFIAFDVKVGDLWLDVPAAADVAGKLGLAFVDYARVSTDLAAVDAQRDRPSVVAAANGCGEQIREGVVLRTIHEMQKKTGERIIAKHKHPLFRETKSVRTVDPEKATAMHDAQRIADEWVTDMRLAHVIDKLDAKLGPSRTMAHTPEVIRAMIEDVRIEAGDEIVWSKDAERAVGSRAAKLWKELVQKVTA